MVTLFIAGGVCLTVLFISLLIVFGILLYDGKIVVPFTSGAKVKKARDDARVAQALAEKQRINLLTTAMNETQLQIAMGNSVPELLALEEKVHSALKEIG